MEIFESNRGDSNCYLNYGEEVTSIGHVSCNLIVCGCPDIGVPIYVAHSYAYNRDCVTRSNSLAKFAEYCPEIATALDYLNQLSCAGYSVNLVSVGESTCTGLSLLQLAYDHFHGKGYCDSASQVVHINPYEFNPSAHMFNVSVRSNIPQLELEISTFNCTREFRYSPEPIFMV